ncbi:unnamed protein product [Acanthosepion pharaonis]|uniref:Uncharacterized protein n=1 Tax=Acanthosepion pharaonis TaxID=158019 RepID=A0A812BTP7_ACAPH|nr:unnamed protein product [Sepia pharaonis]
MLRGFPLGALFLILILSFSLSSPFFFFIDAFFLLYRLPFSSLSSPFFFFIDAFFLLYRRFFSFFIVSLFLLYRVFFFFIVFFSFIVFFFFIFFVSHFCFFLFFVSLVCLLHFFFLSFIFYCFNLLPFCFFAFFFFFLIIESHCIRYGQASLKCFRADDIPFLSQESVSSGESEMSTERTPSPTPDESISPKILENVKDLKSIMFFFSFHLIFSSFSSLHLIRPPPCFLSLLTTHLLFCFCLCIHVPSGT